MTFLKRFTYYLGGFAIGIIVVFFFLGGKKTSCSYFPNERVLKEIRFKTQEISPQAQEFFTKNDIDTIVINKLLHQGKVDFSNSQTSTKEPCRVYLINGKHLEKDLQIKVEECRDRDSIATLTEARFKE